MADIEDTDSGDAAPAQAQEPMGARVVAGMGIDGAVDIPPMHDLSDADEIATRVGRGTIWTTLSTVITHGVLVAQAFLLVLILSPTDFALWGISMSVAGLGMQMRDLSLGYKFVQDKTRTKQEAFDVACTLELVLGVGGMFVIALGGAILGLAYRDPELFLLTLACAPFAFSGLITMPEYVLQRDMRFAARAARTAITSALSFAATVGTAMLGWGPWSFVAGLAVYIVSLLIVLWPIAGMRFHLRWDKEANREYIAFGWPMWAASICLYLFNLLAINAIRILFGTVVTGYYTRVWSLVEFSYKLNIGLTVALYPAVVRVGRDIQRLGRSFMAVNRIIMSASAVAAGILVFFSPDLVLILSSDWSDIAPMLQAVGVFFVFGTLAFDWEVYYRAEGETKPMFLISLYLLAFLPLFLVLVLLIGVTGIYVAIVLVGIYLYVVRSYYARKLLGHVSALRAAWRQLTAIAVAGTIGYAVRTVMGGGVGPGLVGTVVMLAIYGAALLAFERRLVFFVLNTLRGKPTGGLQTLLGT